MFTLNPAGASRSVSKTAAVKRGEGQLNWPRSGGSARGNRTPDTLYAKKAPGTGGPAAAQVGRAAGCSVNDRESPWVAPLTGTWRARLGLADVFYSPPCVVGDPGLGRSRAPARPARSPSSPHPATPERPN